MDQIFCETCGKPLSEKQIEKGVRQHRVIKYCSSECWGKRKRTYEYDHEFLNAWNDFSLYFLGLFVSDGHFSKDDNGISITSVDKQLIDDIVSHTQYKKAVTSHIRKNRSTVKPEYQISFYGDVPKQILSVGYLPGKKSGYEFLPDFIQRDEKLFFSFLRGFIDGDGTIRQYKQTTDKNGIHALSVSAVSMSRTFLVDIINWLYERKITRGGGLSVRAKIGKAPLYRMQFGHFDSLEICKRMYENATIKLDRKYNNYIACKDHLQGCTPQTNTTCYYLECNKPARCEGLCKKHYDQSYRIRYYALNKDKIMEKDRKWKELHKDEINDKRRERYAESPEKYRETSYKWRKENMDKVREGKRKHREEHRDEINAYKRLQRQKDHERVRDQEKASYERNKDQKLARAREYKQEHKEEIAAKNKEYKEKNKEKLTEYFSDYYQKNRERLKELRRLRHLKKKSEKEAVG